MEAKLSVDRFFNVVESRLIEEGFKEPELSSLRDQIIEASANRLVFLVGLEAGQVGFEIRSFQEYMAAEAVMTGPQNCIQARLRSLAPFTTWRNAFLFVAGRCFAQDQHLRDTIYTICTELNEDLAGELGRAVYTGSILALEIMEDGMAQRQPKYTQLLGRCALGLLALPSNNSHVRLSGVCKNEFELILREELEHRLSTSSEEHLSSWNTLLPLIAREVSWAIEIGDRYWPSEAATCATIFCLPTAVHTNNWVSKKISQIESNSPPNLMYPVILKNRPWTDANRKILGPLWYFSNRFAHDLNVEHIDYRQVHPLISLNLALEIAKTCELNLSALHQGWLPLIEAFKFALNPSSTSLAEGLERIANCDEARSGVTLSLVKSVGAWVFSSCLHSASADTILNLAHRARNGQLGDLPQWQAAEQRWMDQGISNCDIIHMNDERCPFDASISDKGIPIGTPWSRISINPRKDVSKPLDLLKQLENNKKFKVRLHRLWGKAIANLSPDFPTSNKAHVVRSYLLSKECPHLNLAHVPILVQWAQRDKSFKDCLVAIGLSSKSFWGSNKYSAPLLELYKNDPSLLGLLPIIAAHIYCPHIFGFKPKRSELPKVNFDDHESVRLRWASVIIELAKGSLYPVRIEALAANTVDLVNQIESASFDNIITVLNLYENYSDVTDMYLLALWKAVFPQDSEDAKILLDAINHSLRRKSSSISETHIWNELELPVGLRDLLLR